MSPDCYVVFGKAVGIDMGVSDRLTLSTGESIPRLCEFIGDADHNAAINILQAMVRGDTVPPC